MEAKTYPEFSSRYPLLIKNLMMRPLRLYPDDIGVVYRSDAGQYYRFTWKQWYERTCQLANAMTKTLGLKPGKPGQPGDRIATAALNHHRHLELCYASTCTGTVAHPINVRLSLEHILYTITHAEDKVLFADDIVMPLLDMVWDRIKDTVKMVVYMSDKPGLPQTRVQPVYEYEELIKNQPKTYDWPELDENTPAVLYYTTGTTGLPKGIMFTHRQLYLQTIHIVAVIGQAPRLPGDPPQPKINVPMVNVPLFHIHGWGAPWQNVYNASKIVFPGRFAPEAFCELVQTEKVTSSGLVPTMLAMLIEYPDFKKWDMSSLTNLGIGGAALPPGLKAKAEKMFPHFSVASGYGMTETAAGSIAAQIKRWMVDWPKDKLDEIRVKTGLAIDGIEAKVVDEKGNEVPHDNKTQGEIVLRGHWIMEQYYKDPERTATAWRDGWFHTGDAAKVDELGYIQIVDRITDVIRSGAEMVPTVLLENITATADFVLEAAYVGVPDEKWGERPMAIIKLAPGANVKPPDVITFLEKEGVDKGKITRWMLPDFVVFTDDIPKTSVGKFDKITIRKKVEEFISKAERVHKV
ncbi:MAG: long-chain-fatty-acid--CoA ligase [Dehalococcoidia bacterium]|nr:long-chain-fatty-acid--CoA ligase [Dehalococcoidia bacterium]